MRKEFLVWKVNYDAKFESSSGSKVYTSFLNNQHAIVWTEGYSLLDVENAIKDGLDDQTYLDKIVSAEYIGKTIN